MSSTPAGFERLLRRACRLEPDALRELVALYSPRVYGLQLRLTGSRETAEDLLQETFLRVVRMIAEYKHDGKFDAWLFRIAANLARDHFRRQRRRGVALRIDHLDDESPGAIPELSDSRHPRPENVALAAETREQLQAALQELSDVDREIILLRHYAELSFREIAETLGIPLGTALARAHRALKRLRTLLGEES